RRALIREIRKNGQYVFNTNPSLNTGELKVMRRPTVKMIKDATDFAVCPQCKGSYAKSAFRHHYRRCAKKNSGQIAGRIHESACKTLREHVFPTMKDDIVSRVIRYDELAIDFANKLCEKYHDPHFYDMIRQKLRQIGRLLLQMKKQNDKIDDLFSIFTPTKYDDCLTAVRILAGLNDTETGFKTPSLATEEFLSLITENHSSSIARTAVETQFQKRKQSKKLLATQSDIKKSESFLSDRLKVARDSLKQTYSLKTWEVLAESCILSIQLFNRRRSGEIERALVEDFKNYQEVNESSIGISYQSLSSDEKKAVEKYVRFIMRGKLGRSVPVLFHKQMLKNVQLLLSYRKNANVHPKNPYPFGVPGTLKGDYTAQQNFVDLQVEIDSDRIFSAESKYAYKNIELALVFKQLKIKRVESHDFAKF
ncbi:hypothetical protein ALC62_03998, partial [Cyphomyrmex costatus]